MPLRASLLLVLLAAAGCESYLLVPVDSSSSEASLAKPDAAITPAGYVTSVPKRESADSDSPSHLILAAGRLEKGDEAGACAHLALHLASHPEHIAVRGHLAELLLRQNRPEAARYQFERFEAEAQEQVGIPLAQRVRCESRLARIAEQREDEYAEHLHRGIGLYLLAQERQGQVDDQRELYVEALLFKAASELTQARTLHPSEARPNLYLYEVWSALSQRHAALRGLRAAESAAPFSYLTPTEHRDLLLARERARTSRDL